MEEKGHALPEKGHALEETWLLQHAAFALVLLGLQCTQRKRTRCTCLQRTSCGGGNREAAEEGHALQLREQQHLRWKMHVEAGEQPRLFSLVLRGTHRSSCVSDCSCISICIHITSHTSHDKHFTRKPQRHLHSSPACMSLEVVMKPWWSFALPVCIAVALWTANNGLACHSHVQFGATPV